LYKSVVQKMGPFLCILRKKIPSHPRIFSGIHIHIVSVYHIRLRYLPSTITQDRSDTSICQWTSPVAPSEAPKDMLPVLHTSF